MIITDALVLRRNAYRDSDRMVTLLSPTHGRLDAIARGCLKPKSPLTNATEMFCSGEYEIRETHGRLSITACRISESFYPLRTDLDRLAHAAYLACLLLTVSVPGESEERAFLTALKALAFYAYGDLPLSLVTMAFELHLLDALGLAPRMDACVRCGRAMDGATRYDPLQGGVLCPRCAGAGATISNDVRRILMRVPRTRFDVIDRLVERPAWQEAAFHARRFVRLRLDPHPSLWPALPGEEEVYDGAQVDR